MNNVKKIPRGSGDDLPSLPKQFPDLDLKKITILINNLNLITDHSLLKSPLKNTPRSPTLVHVRLELTTLALSAPRSAN